MSIVILFGTESGNAEFVAGNLADRLAGASRICDLAEFAPAAFTADDVYLLVCSTYGAGDPPASARPFLVALDRERPDLTGVRFAVFGLGDSSYGETYSHGSEVVARHLAARGATRFGAYGRHDASGRADATDIALAWLETLMPALEP